MANSTDRENLKKKSASLKEAISSNFEDFKASTDDISKAALIGGGVLLAGYLVYKMFKSDTYYEQNPDEKGVIVVNSPQESIIVRNIKAAIVTFLLAIAKQKLVEFLNQKEEKEKDA